VVLLLCFRRCPFLCSSTMAMTREGGQVSIGRRLGARYSVCWPCLLRQAWVGPAWSRAGVGGDKTLGCATAASLPPRPCVVFLPPPAALPLRARGTVLRPFSFTLTFTFLGCALPPVAAFRDASTTEGHLELPRRESKHGPRSSSRTARARRRKGRCRYGHNGCTRVCGGT